MKVLHINQSDLAGGAAIAAYRLHQGLLQAGAVSRMLVGNAESRDASVEALPAMSLAERMLFKLSVYPLPNNTNLLRGFHILNHLWFKTADVVNLHNLHTNLYFNYLMIPGISRKKPVVFTLHDMWGFTGHCAYSLDCERWLTGCGRCPYPHVYPAVRWDNTAIEWWLKKQVYRRSHMTIVVPSQWLARLARQSILSRFPIEIIPYGIDTSIYRPEDKAEARRSLGLPPDLTVLMFACDDLNDPRKGADLLIDLLKSLPPEIKKSVLLYALGRKSNQLEQAVGIKTVQAGFVEGDGAKARCYCAADIFISTSRADNLPLVLLESLSCGTPMLAVNVGGVSDLVRPGVTGLLSDAGDRDQLKQNLVELVRRSDLRRNLGEKCRAIAVEEYALGKIAAKYKSLYETVMEDWLNKRSRTDQKQG